VIGANSSGSIHGVGVAPRQADPSLGARDEEGATGMKNVEAGKINVGAIQDIEGIGLGHDGVKDVNIVQLSVGNLNKSGDWSASNISSLAQSMRPDATVAMAAYGDCGPGYLGTRTADSEGGYETGEVSLVIPEVEGVLMNAMLQSFSQK
jgi:hypothetical protein